MDIRVGISFLEGLDTNISISRLTFNEYNIIYTFSYKSYYI